MTNGILREQFLFFNSTLNVETVVQMLDWLFYVLVQMRFNLKVAKAVQEQILGSFIKLLPNRISYHAN